MKIAVCTMHSPCYAEISGITIPVMKAYCELHGYEFHEIICPDWKFHYVKHEYFKDSLQTDITALLYIDCDALIVNKSVPIESLIDEEHSLFITEDATELNGGVFILKNNEWGHFFNNTVLEESDNFNNEQNVYVHYKEHPNFKPHIKILPQHKLNSYDHSLYPELSDRVGKEDLGDYKPGHFIIHFPALTILKRAEEIKKYIQ
jgi:hypothetical protein